MRTNMLLIIEGHKHPIKVDRLMGGIIGVIRLGHHHRVCTEPLSYLDITRHKRIRHEGHRCRQPRRGENSRDESLLLVCLLLDPVANRGLMAYPRGR